MKQLDTIVKNNFLVLLFLAATLFALYANTLQAPFTFDDDQILENPFIQITSISTENLLKVADRSPVKRRWLPNISFALNYYVGGYDVFGFHLVNIGLHIAAAFVFYLLARQTLDLLPDRGLRERSAEIGLAAALLWAFHPLQTNAVTYIVQRMSVMAALFTLLALVVYVKGRTAARGSARILFFAISLALGFMALLCKENSGILPLLVLGYEFFILAPAGKGGWEWQRIIPAGVVLLLLFLLVCWAFLGSSPLSAITAGYSNRDFTLIERLLTQGRVVVHYLSLLFLPLPSRLNLAYDFQLSSGLLAPVQTTVSYIFHGGLLSLLLLLGPRHRLVSLALFWFGANLLIESSVIPLELIFEHRMYLPAMFPVLAGVTLVYRIAAARIGAARCFLVALLVLLALFTWQRNSVWQSEISLWTDTVKKAPGRLRSYGNLAQAYGKSGEHARAEQLLRQALAINQRDSRTLFNLGVSLANQNRHEEALFYYYQALENPGPQEEKLHRNLARVYLRLNNGSKALEHAQKAANLDPADYDALLMLAAALFRSADLLQAEKALQQAIALYPAKGDAYIQMATIREHQNRLGEAVAALERALAAREVNRAQAYNSLGIVYWRQKKYQASVTAARQAIAIDPQLVDAYLTLGITLEETGNRDEAFKQFRRGWEMGLDMVRLYNDWAKRLLAAGKPEMALIYLQEAIKLDASRPEVYESFAAAYEAMGRAAEALAAGRKAISLRQQ